MTEDYIKVDKIIGRTCEFDIEIDNLKFMADAIPRVHGDYDHVDGVDSILNNIAKNLSRINKDIYGE